MLTEMNQRAQDIFRNIVEAYLKTGEPVGSRTISKVLGTLSPASIRNTMAELEELGLLTAPHTSAGRLPTETGLGLYVDALMEINNLDDVDRRRIENLTNVDHRANLDTLFTEAGKVVSGLAGCAALVAAPKRDRVIRQIQFIHLNPGQTLSILVFADGTIENRMLQLPENVPASALTQAANYLNDRLYGRTLSETRAAILTDIRNNRTQLDSLSQQVAQQGIALVDRSSGQLFVRGTAELLRDDKAIQNIDAIHDLIHLLDKQETVAEILDAAERGEGVSIYIGTKNPFIRHAGLSMIVAPARNAEQQIVGAVAVIGPTRLNYGRVVPIVNLTSQILGRKLG